MGSKILSPQRLLDPTLWVKIQVSDPTNRKTNTHIHTHTHLTYLIPSELNRTILQTEISSHIQRSETSVWPVCLSVPQVEEALVRRKKMELLQRYASESLQAQSQTAKTLLGLWLVCLSVYVKFVFFILRFLIKMFFNSVCCFCRSLFVVWHGYGCKVHHLLIRRLVVWFRLIQSTLWRVLARTAWYQENLQCDNVEYYDDSKTSNNYTNTVYTLGFFVI